MDKSTLASMALGLIGEQEYTSDTPGYETVELYFNQTLKSLLSSADWSFAREKKSLPKQEDGSYRLPGNCLRLIELHGLRRWRIYGEAIHSEDGHNPESVSIVYTSSHLVDCGELPDNIPEFVDCFVEYLASALCMRMLNDKTRRLEHARVAKLLYDKALVHNIQQDNSNDQHPLERLLEQSIVNPTPHDKHG